jgi:hypothetical protein
MTIGAFESELESEAMYEAEAFYENVATAAQQGRSYRPLALLAMKAARAALSQGGAPDPEGEAEAEQMAAWESEGSYHETFNPRDAVPAVALMEHLGHAAAEAETQGESFAFLAPLLPLAAKALPLLAKSVLPKLLPKVAKVVTRVAPKLFKGLKGVAKTLRSNPAGKQLVRTLPQVMQRTVTDIARQAASGQNVTPQRAVQTLAKQTAQVLGNPRMVVQCVRRAATVDRKYHQTMSQCGRRPQAAPCPCSCR